MAVDSLLNKVVELTQDGSTTNQVTPATSRGRTLTGITTGTDHLVFGTSSILESTDGRTTTWDYGPLDATIEMVVELNPTWTYASLVAKGYMWYLACADSGVLRLVLGYTGNYVEYDFSVPTTGKTYISVRLVKDATYGSALDLHLVIQPENGTRRTLTREFQLNSSIMLRTSNTSYGRIADVLLGAMPYQQLSVAPGAEASASWAIVTQGYVSAGNARLASTSQKFQRYSQYTDFDPLSDATDWASMGVWSTTDGVDGAFYTASLASTVGLTDNQVDAVLRQAIAAQISGAQVNTGVIGEPWESWNPITQRTDTGMSYYDSNTLFLPVTAPGMTWSIRQKRHAPAGVTPGGYWSSSATPVTDSTLKSAGLSFDTTAQGVYGSGAGLQAVARLTVNKYTADAYTLYISGPTFPMADTSVNGALHQALTVAFAGVATVTAAALNSSTTIFTLNYTLAGVVYTPTVAVYEQNAFLSAITKLYALRVTEADRAADAAIPALPWPTTSIPGGGGGGALPTDVWLALGFEGGSATDLSTFAHTKLTQDQVTLPTTGSRTSNGYVVTTGTAAALNYDADLNELNGLAEITVEFDVYVPESGAGGGYFFGAAGSDCWYLGTAVGAATITPTSIWSTLATHPITLATNAWHHVAWSADAVDAKSFLGGVTQSTGTGINTLSFTSVVVAGYNFSPLGVAERPDLTTLPGLRMDNVLITKRKKYNADFTPPGAITGGSQSYRYYHLANFDFPGTYTQLWLSELQFWESSSVRATGTAWGATVGTSQGYPPSDGILEDGDLTNLSTSGWSLDFTSYPGTGINPDFALNYDLGVEKLATGFKYAIPSGSADPGLAGVAFDVYGSNSAGDWGSFPAGQTTWVLINRVTVASDPAPGVLSDFVEFYSVPPSNVDVTGAGYNDIEGLLGSGTGNTQANAPDAYGTSNAALDDIEAVYTAYVDAADITGTGTTTLAAYTNSGAGVAAIPTNLDGDNLLDDFTSVADGVADVPLEFTADYTLGDITSVAVGLFLAPSEGSGDGMLDDIVQTTGEALLIDPVVYSLNATVPVATLVFNTTQFFVNATVPAATLSAEVSQYEGFKLDGAVPAASMAGWFGMRLNRNVPWVTLLASGSVPNTLRLSVALPRVTIQANILDGRKFNLNARLPVATLSAWTGWQLAGTVPAATVQGNIVVGGAYTLIADVPKATLMSSISTVNVLSMHAVVPAAARAGWLALSCNVPAARLLARSSAVQAITRVAYSFTLANSAMTRYPAYPFVQLIRMGNAYYGVADDGLYEIGGETDNGTSIPWAWETCMTDFGVTEKKTVVSAYLGGYVPQSMTYTIKAGDVPTGANAHATTATAVLRNHRQKFGIGRKSRFFAFGLSATQGRVAIESIEFEVANMSRRV